MFRWVADVQPDATGLDLDATDELFSTIVLAAPLETRPDGVVARAYRDAEHLEILKDNLIKRDNHSKLCPRCRLVLFLFVAYHRRPSDSTPAVYTFIDNDAFQTRGRAGGQGEQPPLLPWL